MEYNRDGRRRVQKTGKGQHNIQGKIQVRGRTGSYTGRIIRQRQKSHSRTDVVREKSWPCGQRPCFPFPSWSPFRYLSRLGCTFQRPWRPHAELHGKLCLAEFPPAFTWETGIVRCGWWQNRCEESGCRCAWDKNLLWVNSRDSLPRR